MQNINHYRLHQEEKVSHVTMALLAMFIGIIAGLAAVIFHHMIALLHNLFFLGQFSFHYDTNVFTPISPFGFWIIFIPAGVAIIVAWLIKTFAPEAKGHGVPEVMEAIYHKDGKIRPIVAFIKAIASALSIGSGGSVGREGPIVQISAGFGSLLGSFRKIPPRQRAVLVAAGAAAGIGSVFNTPIGAIAFAIELMMVSVSAASIFPVAVATVTATYIGRVFLGVQPPFYVWALTVSHFRLMPPELLGTIVPFGIAMGLLSVLFIKGLYFFEDLFDEMPGNAYTRHVLGMLCVGMIIYSMARLTGHYYVDGVGYSTIMHVLRGLFLNPWFLLLLVALKLLSTFLTIGSGASGGIFSPSLFLGAVFGNAFGLLLRHFLPGFEINPIVFAIAGMAGMVGGITGAVLTSIIMVTEMTHDTNIIMPIIITVVVAYVTRKIIMNESIYTLKLLRRGTVVPEGLQSAMSMALRAKNVMSADVNLITVDEFKNNRKKYLDDLDQNIITVIKNDKKILGVLKYSDVCEDIFNIQHYLDERFLVMSSQARLPIVIQEMEAYDMKYVLVAPHCKKGKVKNIIGVITEHTILHVAYQTSKLLY